jgi:hypothetical protein
VVGEPIKVEGLAEVNRALRKLDKDAPKGLRLANNEAADLLVSKTIPKIPRKSGAAAKSVRAQSTRTSARVSIGGPRAPYLPWLDFGGQGRIAGRPAPRQFIKEGRYVFPTLEENQSQIGKALQDALGKVVADAGLETT